MAAGIAVVADTDATAGLVSQAQRPSTCHCGNVMNLKTTVLAEANTIVANHRVPVLSARGDDSKALKWIFGRHRPSPFKPSIDWRARGEARTTCAHLDHQPEQMFRTSNEISTIDEKNSDLGRSRPICR